MRKPGLYADIPEAEYHADRISLSVSGAKTLLKSPAQFIYEREHPVHKDAFDFGTAAHALALGAGMESVYVTPYDDFKTKAAQAEKRAAQDDGLAVITPSDWNVVCDMAEAITRHPMARDLLTGGEPEVSAYCPDEKTGVIRRGRVDYLRDDLIVDYKTTRNADPNAFARDAGSLNYHMQHAWYLDLLRDLGRDIRGFIFIAQCKEPPYLVSVVELVPAAVELGRTRNQLALQVFRDCTESNLWPGYPERVVPIDVPTWAYYDNPLEYQ